MAPTAQEAITSYITDMVALEQHLQKALAGQIEDLGDERMFVSELQAIHATCELHIAELERLANARGDGGQGIAEAVKKAASTVLGFGAAAVDFVRTEKLPKNLRDDYTAVSLACIGYVMLHTTALSLGDGETAAMAHRHLRQHAQSTMSLHNIIPAAVVKFLQDDGLPAQSGVLSEVADNIESVWQDDGGITQGRD